MGQTFRMQPGVPDTGAAPPGVVATWFGVEVPQDPSLLPELIDALQDGSFAETRVRPALAAIRPADRVLHLGAGPGAVAAAIAGNCRPASILSFERDPRLVAQARALHRHNGLQDRITLRRGVVLAEPWARESYGPSSTLADAARPDEVPVTRHDRLRRAYLHNVIIMNIEGAERAFLRHANLSGVRLVLVDLHPGIYGREGVRACRRALGRAGYERDLSLSGAEVDVFRRIRA
jgi:FkbM family methyltransferase